MSYTNSRNFVSAMGESSPPLSYWGPYILSSTTQNIITHQRREENAARGLQYTHGHNVNWTAAIQSCSQGKNRKKDEKKKSFSLERALQRKEVSHKVPRVCVLSSSFYISKERRKKIFLFIWLWPYL